MGAGEVIEPVSYHHNYSYIFETYFPYYLSLGMSEEQYWDKDCELVKAYRKKREYETQYKNGMFWLQGQYMYDILQRFVPVLNPMCKKPELKPYIDKPYELNVSHEDREKKEENLHRNEMRARFLENASKLKR